MRAFGAMPLVFRSYLIQGVAAGALTAVIMPSLAQGGMELGQYSEQSALALLPWCLKLMWAPAIDRFTQSRGGSLRRWIALTQILTGLIALALLGIVDIEKSQWGWGLSWLAINAGLAAQDTATDAAAIRYIAPSRRSGANAAMQFGHALGASVFAGMFLGAIARRYGLASVGLCMGGLLLVAGLYEYFDPRQGLPAVLRDDPRPDGAKNSTRAWLAGALIAATALLTQAITSTAAGGFLFQRLAWTVEQYQSELHPLSTVVSLLAFALWSRLLLSISPCKSFLWSSLGIGALWIALGFAEPLWDLWGRPLIWVYAVQEGLLTAAWTASLYALLMKASQGRHAALLFAGLMTLMNLSRLAGTLLAPQLLHEQDYAQLWILVGVAQLGWSLLCHTGLRAAFPEDVSLASK